MNCEQLMIFLKESLRFLPDKMYLNIYFKLRLHRKIKWDNPKYFNDKLQWLKFNYRFPLQSIVSDK